MSDNQTQSRATPAQVNLDQLSPREIARQLDRFIVGQQRAKRAVAIALRNRIRRHNLTPQEAEEIYPKNLILIGPTGVGKTEIARRLAKISNSPFIKLEASKFTEVGYVGRDVESIIRDLVDVSVQLVREEKISEIGKKAERNAEEKLLDLLLDPPWARKGKKAKRIAKGRKKTLAARARSKKFKKAREKLRRQLRAGKLDRRRVELEIPERVFPGLDMAEIAYDEVEASVGEFFSGIFHHTTTRKMNVEEAIDYLIFQEESRLIDMEQVTREALQRVEESGIVFLDELDKIAGRESGHGPNVSREGVQRDILPIVEGTNVATRYGMVRTDHILFIAAGAFHVAKPSDLIPELQGRFPIRVEMDSLSEDDLVRILREPENSLIKQYQSLLATEGVELVFTDEAVVQIARYAKLVNETTENIGARRLHTIMESLLDEVSFSGAELGGEKFVIDVEYVDRQLAELVRNQDLSRYIL